jgi:hypothetical protein
MLGLAPLAAKISFNDALLGNLSSAYDYRFGNSTYGTFLGINRSDCPGRLSVPTDAGARIDYLNIEYWGRLPMVSDIEFVEIPLVLRPSGLSLYEPSRLSVSEAIN